MSCPRSLRCLVSSLPANCPQYGCVRRSCHEQCHVPLQLGQAGHVDVQAAEAPKSAPAHIEGDMAYFNMAAQRTITGEWSAASITHTLVVAMLPRMLPTCNMPLLASESVPLPARLRPSTALLSSHARRWKERTAAAGVLTQGQQYRPRVAGPNDRQPWSRPGDQPVAARHR